MIPLLALTLWRPWPWTIVHGPKRLENRPWRPPAKIIGQRIALHAGQTYDNDAVDFIRGTLHLYGTVLPPVDDGEKGIVGLATVISYVSTAAQVEALNLRDSFQAKWFMGPYAWVLGDVIALPKPLPCPGKQKLWTVPAELAAQVREYDSAALEVHRATGRLGNVVESRWVNR